MKERSLVGRILFINEDGGPQFTAYYSLPFLLREPEIFTENGVYHQNHQVNGDGQFVYKYMRPLVGPPSEYLTDYRYPADADWDGPRPSRPMATWDLLNTVFGDVIHSGCTPLDLLNLRALAYAAFHKLPVPEPLAESPLAVPVGLPADPAFDDPTTEIE